MSGRFPGLRLARLGHDPLDKVAVFALHCQLAIDLEPPSARLHRDPAERVVALLLEALPVDPRPRALPERHVVEVDPVLVKKLILERGRLGVQGRRRLLDAFPYVAERPVAPTVQRAPGGVGLPPPDAVEDVLLPRADPGPAVE